MRFLSTAITISAAILLAACASKPPAPKVEEVVECKFPENPNEKAPTWVCPPNEVAGIKDTGFGTHPKSGAGYQFSLDQATAKGRAALAAQVQASVAQSIKDYAATTGAAGSETVDRAASSTNSQLTSQKLAGSKVMRSAVDGKGNVYVLVGMDLEASKRLIQQALQTSMGNEPAIWQKMQANRSQAEMQAEILKMGEKR